MKNKQGLLVGIALVLVLALVSVMPAMAQDTATTPVPATEQAALTASTDFFVNSAFVVNVRSGPGTEYTVVGKMFPGDSLDITGQNADATWLRVNFNGQEAWVAASVIVVVGDLTTAPVAEAGATAVLRSAAPVESDSDVVEDAAVVAVTSFNSSLRELPTLRSTRLTVIPFDTQLSVLARNENNNWVQVSFDENTGWISSGLLFFAQGNIDTLPVITEDGTMFSAEEFNALAETSTTSGDAATTP